MTTIKESEFVCLPTAYTISNFSGIKCLCIMSKFDSKQTLVCIPLSIINVTYYSIKGKSLKEKEVSDIRDEIINYFENDPQRVKTWENKSIVRIRGSGPSDFDIPNVEKLEITEGNIVQILASFSHTPYTPFMIIGEYTLTKNSKRTVAFFKSLSSWVNVDKTKISSKIDEPNTLYFDIETETTGSEFPIPSREGILAISLAFNDEPIQIYTVLPADQLYQKYDMSKITLPQIILFETQMEIINAFMNDVLKADRILQFNGNSFDWPFIIGVIERIDPNYWARLSEKDGRTISVGIQTIITPVGPQNKTFLSIPGIEHIDLIYPSRRLFPFWMNHKLDTVSKELVNKGKTKFTMKKYFALVQEYKTAKKNNTILSDMGIELMMGALEYSGVDTEILREIYKFLLPYQKIAQELCGLTQEAWTKSTEATGFLTRVSPVALFSYKKVDIKLNLTQGFHTDIKIYLFNEFALNCITSSEIKNFILNLRTSDKYSLKHFGAFFNQLIEYPAAFDYDKYWDLVNDKVKKVVCDLGLYTYTNEYIDDANIVYNYDVIIVPSKASYILLNINSEDEYDFAKKGLSKLCKPLPKRLDDVLFDEISKIRDLILEDKAPSLSIKLTDSNIEKLLFPSGKHNFYIDEFVNNVRVRPDNADKYDEFLTPEELIYLQTGGEFINLSYLRTDKGFVRVYYPYKKDLIIIPNYYIDLLKEHLEVLNKLISPKKPRGRPKTIKEEDISDIEEELDEIDSKLDQEMKDEILIQEQARKLRQSLDRIQKERLSLQEEKNELIEKMNIYKSFKNPVIKKKRDVITKNEEIEKETIKITDEKLESNDEDDFSDIIFNNEDIILPSQKSPTPRLQKYKEGSIGKK